MELYTLNVGQGNLAVLRGDEEAVIIDTHIPSSTDKDAEFVRAALVPVLKDRKVTGLILTGWDCDHADPRGVPIILNAYFPQWVMFPDYEKGTETADGIVRLIRETVERRKGSQHPLRSIPVRVDRESDREPVRDSDDWTFRAFAPHPKNMGSSNNSSLVVKVESKRWLGGFTYLITGDTEQAAWESICEEYGDELRADVMACPHHGSLHGASEATLKIVKPDVLLISAGSGDDNIYDHPSPEFQKLLKKNGVKWHSTHRKQSFKTYKHLFFGVVTEQWSSSAQ